MSDEDKIRHADDKLADSITKALTREKLVASKKRDELWKKIKVGQMTEEDWQVMIESALPVANEGGNGGETD